MGFEKSAFSRAASALRTNRLGSSFAQKPSSKQASAGMIDNQFRKDRLPLKISVTCNKIIITPAICLPIRGQKTKTGAISSASQLNHTPALKTEWGRKWNQRLSGPGIGWVSK